MLNDRISPTRMGDLAILTLKAIYLIKQDENPQNAMDWLFALQGKVRVPILDPISREVRSLSIALCATRDDEVAKAPLNSLRSDALQACHHVIKDLSSENLEKIADLHERIVQRLIDIATEQEVLAFFEQLSKESTDGPP